MNEESRLDAHLRECTETSREVRSRLDKLEVHVLHLLKVYGRLTMALWTLAGTFAVVFGSLSVAFIILANKP